MQMKPIHQAFFPLSNTKMNTYIRHLALHSNLSNSPKNIKACLSQHYRLFFIINVCIANLYCCKFEWHTVNIWVHSEGIERAFLPSEGIFTLNLKALFDFGSSLKLLHLVFKCNSAISGQKCQILIALSFAWEMLFNSWKNSISKSKGRFWAWGDWKGTFT